MWIWFNIIFVRFSDVIKQYLTYLMPFLVKLRLMLFNSVISLTCNILNLAVLCSLTWVYVQGVSGSCEGSILHLTGSRQSSYCWQQSIQFPIAATKWDSMCTVFCRTATWWSGNWSYKVTKRNRVIPNQLLLLINSTNHMAKS